ncbi:MAG TPA: response regulator transcription factor [Anaerolineae bacterium]|jgi:LuxR family maltose regulon positive regulatory protein
MSLSKSIDSTQTLNNRTAQYPEPAIEPLSERELEVLQWLACGTPNREIGRRLYIAESTVKRHVYNIFGKLNVRNRTQAALQARKLGLKPQPDFMSQLWEGSPG